MSADMRDRLLKALTDDPSAVVVIEMNGRYVQPEPVVAVYYVPKSPGEPPMIVLVPMGGTA